MRKDHVAIVGGGLGGLALASRLAQAGNAVSVFEQEAEVGGRLGREVFDGFSFDIGPTILLFPDVLRAHFRELGANADDALDLVRCDPNYRVHFRDGSNVTLMRDREALTRELERFAPGSSAGFFRYLKSADKKKSIAFDVFLREPFSNVLEMAQPKVLRGLFAAEAHRSVANVAFGHVEDERLRMALTFQTMYLGVSPFDAPALFGLLPSTEFGEGIWYVKGGLARISKALADLATKNGASIETNAKVRAIETNGARTTGVTLEDGRFVRADLVVANADLPYAYRKLLGRPLRRPLSYTSSALILLLGTNRKWDGLLHHNVFFGNDYAESFRDLFERHRTPADPSFYVAEPSGTDASVAKNGGSAIYVLVPVPHLHPQGPNWHDKNEIARLREHVIERLEREVTPGLRESIVSERAITPLDWRSRFSLEHGSAFGLAHTLDQVAAFRPAQRDATLENLYFVGASTQPATGIPNVLIGAKQVSERILSGEWRASTKRKGSLWNRLAP